MESQFLRILLIVYEVGAVILTISYLRYRRCSALELALWGMLAICLPVLGPFFVIAARPGPRKRPSRNAPVSRITPTPKG